MDQEIKDFINEKFETIMKKQGDARKESEETITGFFEKAEEWMKAYADNLCKNCPSRREMEKAKTFYNKASKKAGFFG